MAVPGLGGWQFQILGGWQFQTLGHGSGACWLEGSSRGLRSGAAGDHSTMERFGWEGSTEPSQFPQHGQGQLPCASSWPWLSPPVPRDPCWHTHPVWPEPPEGHSGTNVTCALSPRGLCPLLLSCCACSVLSLCALCENCHFHMFINLSSLPTFLFCPRL